MRLREHATVIANVLPHSSKISLNKHAPTPYVLLHADDHAKIFYFKQNELQ